MKIVSVVGARPQFIKLFPISRAIPIGVEHEIVHTGQHYDESMSQVFFDELSIPRPIVNLAVGSGTHAQQTAAMMIGLEKAFLETKPDVVLVYGDTNSTLAAAVVASKMHIPLAHLEAGLRSFNRKMPEELNRIVTDHLSDLLLAPSRSAMDNLSQEGLRSKSIDVGDVMVDSTFLAKELITRSKNMPPSKLESYIFCTIHRAENTDDPKRLSDLLNQLANSPIQVILAAHPRILDKCESYGLNLDDFNLQIIPPQPYLSSIKLILESSGVITDSGGIQKEAYLLGIPALTLRNETEWKETLVGGWNTLDPMGNLISSNWVGDKRFERSSFLGSGDAAPKVVNSLINYAELTVQNK